MEEGKQNPGNIYCLKDGKADSVVKCDDNRINFIEQFVSEVVDFSSQYGSDTSISYTAYNLTGKPSKFPDYGDFPQVFVMKTYGNWWKDAPSKALDYMPQNLRSIPSDDYIDVKFEQSVYPFRVSIYETYNPGTVVRIWAKNDSSKAKMWSLLYEGEPSNIGHVPRIFSPVISTICFKTSTLRIEFNHSKLDYYTGIDAILLVGTKQPISSECGHSNNLNLKNSSMLGKLTQQVYELNLHSIPDSHPNLERIISHFHKKEEENIFKGEASCRSLENLPDETILKILSYLDLLTLRSCSKLNRHFNALANDSLLYTSLSLNPYWDKMYDDILIGFTKRCQHLQRLDLSWCGNYNMISSLIFKRFISECCNALTHLRLNSCKFVTDSVLKTLVENCQKLEEIGLRNCVKLTDSGFFYLSGLNRLERLDLYRTNITSESLIEILKANENIEHLNIGSCIKITNMDEIATILSTYNKRVKSLDFWKTSNLTQIGVAALGNCNRLEEIDFGWCLGFALPVDSLVSLANGCPNLRKLFLTALRGICDKDLEPFLRKCPNLEQIDLLGVRGITADICLRLLAELPRLKLLDLSFCDQIPDSQVLNWKSLFPKVSIKRSFQTEASNNFLYQI